MEKKAPTIKEIAKRLNISVSTVSRALHNHPSIGLRTKTQVQQLAKELNYEPNQTAIFFKQGKTFTLGVILPNLGEEFFSQAISGIEDAATRNNYNVLVGQSHDDVEREKQIVETMRKHRVDGILVSVSKNTYTYEHFEQLTNYNIPVVFFDRVPREPHYYKVNCSMLQSTTEAVLFLLKSGHKRIGFLKGPESIGITDERQEGYEAALKKNRLKIDPALIADTDLTKESTHKAMQQLLSLKNRPTAIVAFNDYVALDAIQYAKKMKMKVNKDICFVSYANLPIVHYLDHPPMASVEQFPYQQGEEATNMLMQLLNKDVNGGEPEKKHVILESLLVFQEEQ